jgi:phycoerythrin-associated linker protein
VLIQIASNKKVFHINLTLRSNLMALWITDTDPVELRAAASEDDLQTVIRAVYRQVLGNTHVMDSQRLSSAESLLRNGDITVRGFVRLVAQSELYQSLFFDTASPYRFIELNFKHLLGRAPSDQSEIAEHVVRYNASGYSAEIDSYIDSEEYLQSFGETVVPYARGSRTQTGLANVGFNRSFALMRGNASHSGGKQARLISDVAGNLPTKIASPSSGSGAYNNTGKRFRITISKVGGARVTRAQSTVEVDYSSLSQRIKSIQKSGGKILNISEVA